MYQHIDNHSYYTENFQNEKIRYYRVPERSVYDKQKNLSTKQKEFIFNNIGFTFNHIKGQRYLKSKKANISKVNHKPEKTFSTAIECLQYFEQIQQILIMENKNLKLHSQFLLNYIEKVTKKNHNLNEQLKSSKLINKQLSNNLAKLSEDFVIFKQECEKKMHQIGLKWSAFNEKIQQKPSKTNLKKSSSFQKAGIGLSNLLELNTVFSMGQLKDELHKRENNIHNDQFYSARTKDDTTRCETNTLASNLITFGLLANNQCQKQQVNKNKCSIQNIRYHNTYKL